MRILGLGGLDHNGAACLLEDGRIASFLEVERVTRRKNQGLDTPAALAALLDRLGIDRVEHVAVADQAWFEQRSPWLQPALDARFPGIPRTIHLHHACHVAAAMTGSGRSSATVISLDGKGDGLSAAAGLVHAGQVPVLAITVPSAHSIGRLWWAASEYAGLPGHHAAGKTMALAAYGTPRFHADLARHWQLDATGGFRLTPQPGESPDLFRQVPRLVDWMARIARTPAAPRGAPRQPHCDMAASLQAWTEELVIAFVTEAVQRTGCRDVCMAGGVALNGLANQRLLASGVVDSLHIPPFTDDRGLAAGAAVLAAVALGQPIRTATVALSPFLGPAPAAWDGADSTFSRCTEGEATLAEVVERLQQGQIVGWFEGADEAGPRALGHRSVLASPTDVRIRDRLNQHVKRREPWRPFGCSVLESEAATWFDMEGSSPWMLRIVQARDTLRHRIVAALHIDGSTRLQTITPSSVPGLARLLGALSQAGHPPVLLHTSMNGPGEPIVHTAAQAFAFARSAGLDALMVDSRLYTLEA